jgi:hypothetical protein
VPVRAVEPPPTALSTLARVDYADAFVVDVTSTLSGEAWARETLERASASTRTGLRRGWTALGLKLDHPGAPDHILGWGVRHSDEEFALLSMPSRIGMPAELLFKPQPDTLLFATFVRHENVLARALWAAIAPRHLRIVPRLLERAAARA